ncbi:MAG TPA: TolC family protein [Candidatus Eisenbacteria bacterium]
MNRSTCSRAALAVLVPALAVAAARPARALDVEGALRQVAAANPTLAARRAMADASSRRVAPAGAWESPMLEAGVENVPVTGRFDTEPMTMKVLGVTQRVPVFGANRLAADAARAGATAERAGVDMTRNDLFGMGLEAYGDAWVAAALRDQAQAHVAVMERLVRSARARYESGAGRLEDVLRSQAEQARTRADVETYRAEERSARARLDALRGVTPGTAADTLAPVHAAPVPDDPAPWLAAVDEAQPRLRELSAEADRYRLAAQSARRSAWPDLELRGAYGWRETLADGQPQDNLFSATVGLTLPIFAGARQGSEGAEMDAMARVRASERDAARLELASQVSAAHADAAAAQRMARVYADSVVTVLERAVDASWAAYSAGTTDLWRVFESSHELYGEEVALLRARQDLVRAQARMLSLTGRGDLLGIALPPPEGGSR